LAEAHFYFGERATAELRMEFSNSSIEEDVVTPDSNGREQRGQRELGHHTTAARFARTTNAQGPGVLKSAF